MQNQYDFQEPPVHPEKTNKQIRYIARLLLKKQYWKVVLVVAIMLLPPFLVGRIFDTLLSYYASAIVGRIFYIVYYPIQFGCLTCFYDCYLSREISFSRILLAFRDSYILKVTLLFGLFSSVFNFLILLFTGSINKLFVFGSPMANLIFLCVIQLLVHLIWLYLSVRFFLIPYVLMTNTDQLSLLQLAKKSWERTRRKGMRIIAMQLSFIGKILVVILLNMLLLTPYYIFSDSFVIYMNATLYLSNVLLTLFPTPHMDVSTAGLANELLKESA